MSNDIRSMFRTNVDEEVHGKWVRLGRTQFLLARMGGRNTKFINAYSTAMQPYQRQQQLGKLTEEDAKAITIPPFVQHCLLDWRHENDPLPEDATDEQKAQWTEFREHEIADGDQFIRYSKEAAAKLLKEIPDLFAVLVETAGKMATYSADNSEASVGNS